MIDTYAWWICGRDRSLQCEPHDDSAAVVADATIQNSVGIDLSVPSRSKTSDRAVDPSRIALPATWRLAYHSFWTDDLSDSYGPVASRRCVTAHRASIGRVGGMGRGIAGIVEK